MKFEISYLEKFGIMKRIEEQLISVKNFDARERERDIKRERVRDIERKSKVSYEVRI